MSTGKDNVARWLGVISLLAAVLSLAFQIYVTREIQRSRVVCWDGVSVDLPDHRAHVSYSDDQDSACGNLRIPNFTTGFTTGFKLNRDSDTRPKAGDKGTLGSTRE